jgi:hypothetical protein
MSIYLNGHINEWIYTRTPDYILRWVYTWMSIYTTIWLYTEASIYTAVRTYKWMNISWGGYEKGWWVSFFGYKLGSGSEKAGGAGREARKSMEVGAGLCLFLPALPAYQKQGGKVSLSYSMTYEGFLPAPPAPRKFLSLNRRKPAP